MKKEGIVKGTGTRHRSRRNERDYGILRNIRQINMRRKYDYNIYEVLEFIHTNIMSAEDQRIYRKEQLSQ